MKKEHADTEYDAQNDNDREESDVFFFCIVRVLNQGCLRLGAINLQMNLQQQDRLIV